MRKVNLFLMLICAALVFTGCNNDDDIQPTEAVQKDPEPEPEPDVEVLKGVFLDEAVQGLSFKTATQNGITNAAGEFTYVAGETVTFSLGDLELGSAMAEAVVTPINLAQSTDANAGIESLSVQNIAALLQTLDEDGDAENGINILPSVTTSIGVSAIDFESPIQGVLADIVINVASQTGLDLDLVYPNEAAEHLAASLQIDFDAEPDYVQSHFIPTYRSTKEIWEGGFISPTVVYKSSYDSDGRIQSIEVISKYSGNPLMSILVLAHAEDGQPSSISETIFREFGKTGTYAGFTPIPFEYTVEYDEAHHIAQLKNDNGVQTVFSGYTEGNRPMSIVRETTNASFETTVSNEITYENGLVSTNKRILDQKRKDADNNIIRTLVTTRNFELFYNENKLLTEIKYDRVFDEMFISDGEEISSLSEAIVVESLEYDSTNKLTGYTVNENNTLSDGGNLIVDVNHVYDENEILLSINRTTSNGSESNSIYENGFLAGSQSFLNEQITFESTFNPDGTIVDTNYYYLENGTLSSTAVTTLNENYVILDRIFSFYTEDGTLDLYYDQDFNEDGIATQESGFYADGVLFGIWFYDLITGQIIKQENYIDNELTGYWISNYDANGLLETQQFYNVNDVLETTVFYEEGVAVKQEYYNEDGEVIDTIFFNGSGKAAIETGSKRRTSLFNAKSGLNKTSLIAEKKSNRILDSFNRK